jgi:PadR family transcriptional regulator PadR
MGLDKTLVTRSTGLMLLKLLQEQDMYGYQMIEELSRRSDQTFLLKAGTLYPLLHDLWRQGLVVCYEKTADTGRVRKFYSLTKDGHATLEEKVEEWAAFSGAVNKVLAGGAFLATV